MLKNSLKKGIAVVLTLMLAFSVFAITASATTVSSAYDSEFTALMTDKYDSSLIFSSGDIGLANYDIVSQGKSWSNANWNTRYNYIQYVPGKETEIVSKESYNTWIPLHEKHAQSYSYRGPNNHPSEKQWSVG